MAGWSGKTPILRWQTASSRMARDMLLPPPVTETRKTVLIVEDDPAARKLLTEILSFAGFSAVAVGSGEEAVPAAVADRPDVVLLDVGLPGIDGWETLRRLQAV